MEYNRMFSKLPIKFIIPFEMGVVCFETPEDCIFELIGFFRRHNPWFCLSFKLTLSTKAETPYCLNYIALTSLSNVTKDDEGEPHSEFSIWTLSDDVSISVPKSLCISKKVMFEFNILTRLLSIAFRYWFTPFQEVVMKMA